MVYHVRALRCNMHSIKNDRLVCFLACHVVIQFEDKSSYDYVRSKFLY